MEDTGALPKKLSRRVVLVGRPNVGKSRLFNRLCRRRIAIVHDRAGVTRDVLPEEIFSGVLLSDTGGIGPVPEGDGALMRAMEEQIDAAIAAADLILFVVDASVGCLPLDFEIAQRLRRTGRPIRLLANKADVRSSPLHIDSFSALGLGPALAISAEHGQGEEALRQELQGLEKKGPEPPSPEAGGRCRKKASGTGAESGEGGRRSSWPESGAGAPPTEALIWFSEAGAVAGGGESRRSFQKSAPSTEPPASTSGSRAESGGMENGGEADRAAKPVALCFAGRPNVGKSSLVNALLREKRAVVSAVPGTTRDAVAYRLDFSPGDSGEVWHFRLLDTAGVRARRKISSPLDYFSRLRTEQAIAGADVVFLVIDAPGGLTKSDQQLAARVLEAGRGLVVVVNKWDLAQKAFGEGRLEGCRRPEDFQKNFLRAIGKELPALPGVTVCFTSALTADPSAELLGAAQRLYARLSQSLGTGALNRALQQLLEAHPPAPASGRRFKIYYATQTGSFPFRLKIFCNRRERLAESYGRFLENGLRRHFHLEGCPIRFEWVGKERRGVP